MEAKRRLIDANALMQKMSANFQQSFQYGVDTSEFSIVEETILEAPTVNAEEIVRGRWIVVPWGVKCSVCGFVCDDEIYLGQRKGCPNCWAKMDK